MGDLSDRLHAEHLDHLETEIARLEQLGDRLAELALTLLGPLSTTADPATVARHQEIRRGVLAEWAHHRRRP